MAEYNPSKIIKDGNTYNFRDTTKIPLSGSNQISGDLIPATDNSIDIGSSTNNIKMLYTKGITINGTQFLPSDYATLSGLATVATSGSYTDLSDKPTIPTVNNATLTIQKNGTDVATFSANSSTNATANITVPTKTSDLTNDSGFITEDNTKIPLAGSNQISGDLIPSTNNAINIGSSTKNIKMLYTKGITIDAKTIDTDANDNMTFNGHIVDTIEEQGGEYIRYSNGIQICWGYVDAGNQTTKTFPKSFSIRPLISVTVNSTDTNSKATATCTAQAVTVYNNFDYYGSFYIAIGRWK